MASLRLAASDPRHAASALLTRRYGPGMVIPAIVDAKPGAAVPAASDGLDRDPRRPNGWFPWEQRALGALDWYAAFHLFAVIVPGGLILAEAAPAMTPAQVILAFGAAIASLITAVGVMDASRAALQRELARLAAVAVLAPALADPLRILSATQVRAFMAVLALSALVVLRQLSTLPAAKAKSA